MRIMKPDAFLEQTGEPHSHEADDLDISQYLGAHYACACGRTHTLGSKAEAIREMNDGSGRIVLACPTMGQRALTLVRFRHILAPRGLAEMGCKFDEPAVATT